MIDLFLFSTDTEFVSRSVAAGIDAIIIDWEFHGKHERQSGADTEINSDTDDDLRRVRAVTPGSIICRINPVVHDSTDKEVEAAIECGTTEILLPMVQSPHQVTYVLDRVRGRCGVGMLIETTAAVECAADLATLPLSRVYVGLNDLAIARRSPSIFDAVADGTVEQLREVFSVPFGFGGLTLPDGGHPVPCRLLLGEMARLDCQFSFLRRSFHRDTRGRSLPEGVAAMRQAQREAFARSEAEVAADREALAEVIGRPDEMRR